MRGGMKNCLWIVQLLLTILFLYSCGSKKIVTQDVEMSTISASSYLKTVIENAPKFDEFSAKMRLSFLQGKESISVGGSIKMKKDEVIQLSIVAAGIVEAARIELTPQRMLVLDRIGRRYVEIGYDELSFIQQCKLDFYTLQSLFWNEIFLPGKQHVKDSDVHNFDFVRDETHMIITAEKDKPLSYSFMTTFPDGLLEETLVRVNVMGESEYKMNWCYSDFFHVAEQKFPTSMNLSLHGMDLQMTVAFSFSRCETMVEYTPLTIPSRYKQVGASDILKSLLIQ